VKICSVREAKEGVRVMSENNTKSIIPYSTEYYAKPNDIYFKVADMRMRRLAIVIVSVLQPESSLDIGCAHGLLVYWLRKKNVMAYGVDISASAFSMSPENTNQYLTKLNVETDNLPFDDGTIGLVTSLEVIEHFKNLESPFKEINRVLKPGGYLFITTPLPLTDGKVGQFLLGRGWQLRDNTHVNVHSRAYWKSLMETFGFSYIDCFAQAFKGTPSELLPARILSQIPGGNVLRAFLSGACLFQKE
jgi:2-polyprenyl-3-methyl-5-hydroxy-6-metoxy-1,4-benzoquinol methylase